MGLGVGECGEGVRRGGWSRMGVGRWSEEGESAEWRHSASLSH